MKFWNFCHNVIGIHLYEFLALALALIMVVFLIVHLRKDKKRTEEYEKKLEELKGTPASSADEIGKV